MKQSLLFTLMVSLLSFSLFSQKKIDHWEMVFNYDKALKYYDKATSPDVDWNKTGYTENADWKSGVNVLGFGAVIKGCSFCTFAQQTTTVYTRTVFNVADTSKIESLVLNLYYLDGVVAYINGIEVARGNLGTAGTATSVTQTADSTMPSNYNCEYYVGFSINKKTLSTCLTNGNNLLAVELHNDAVDVSEAAYQMALFAGYNATSSGYTPSSPNFPFPVELDSTKLPIVLIDVPGNYIPDNSRVTASMKVIYNAEEKVNHLNDSVFNYNGKITIERRGSSSAGFPKHPYGFTTIDNAGEDVNVSLMGLPEENDWIFKGEFQDRTLLRDVLTNDLARKTGHYAPRTKFCEFYINGTHLGLFTLTEKIKRDTFCVDIAKLKTSDNTGLDVTGGYILKLDKTTGTYGGGFSSQYKAPLQSSKPFFQYEYPKGDDITAQQKSYISGFINEFETVLRSNNYKDIDSGYRKYISTKSFIDYMLVQEVARNVDGYRLSTFLYKEKDKSTKPGKLHMGPVWDFNLAYGYSGQLCGSSWSDEGWGYDYNHDCPGDANYIPFWWDRLLQDPAFRDELKTRWDELRNGSFNTDSIMAYLDSTIAQNKEGIDRNFEVWDNVFKNYIWPNNPIADDYAGEITYLKNFITNRLTWIDNNIPEVHEEIDYQTDVKPVVSEIGQVKVYPVPFKENLNVEFVCASGKDVRFSVYSLDGNKIYTKELTSVEGANKISWNGVQVNGNVLNTGVYVYTLELDNRIVARNKILKQ